MYFKGGPGRIKDCEYLISLTMILTISGAANRSISDNG